MTNISYSKEVPVVTSTDVLVIGGGPGGFAAAVASARNGAKTMLIETTGTLGGMATSGLVGPFMTCYDNDAEEQIVKGIFEELVVRAEQKGGAIHPSKIKGLNSYASYYYRSHQHVTPYQSEIIAVTMDEMALEAGVDILFYTRVCDCVVKDGKIDYVVVAMKEGLRAIKANIYIDCTGDADVAYFAGVDFCLGDKETGAMQPATLFFEVGNIDREKYIGELEAHKHELDNNFRNCFSWYVDEARKNGDWHIPRNELGNYEQNIPGRFKINTTRVIGIDGTKSEDLTRAHIECRKQVQEILNFMKKYIPGCENVQLIQVAPVIGVRETRHIVGMYELTDHDILNRAIFDDAICTFGYAVDVHAPDGSGGVFATVDKYYTIPYRCLVPKGCDNLLVAGRSISGSSYAAASFRVMPCCMALGQAAGTAAAMVSKEGKRPIDVDIKALQQKLVEQGAVIKKN